MEGIDFPHFGVCRARNDGDVLTVETYVGNSKRADEPTEFRVTKVSAGSSATIVCDGEVHTDWMQDADDVATLWIKTTIAPHLFIIQTGTATTATKL